MPPPSLVLWDIDHTLIETRGVGGAVFSEAFEAATGTAMSAGMAKAHGETEPVLLEKTLELNGVQDRDERLFARFAAAQAEGYRSRVEELRQRGRVLPGVHEALAILAGQPQVVQSVLTGNTRAAAQIKLSAFGLDRYVDLEIGAYGDDDSHRPHLVEIAMTRAAQHWGQPATTASTVLIGDTPNDVRAAHEAGVGVVAVASGSSSVAALVEAGAEVVAATLESAGICDLLNRALTSRAAAPQEPGGRQRSRR